MLNKDKILLLIVIISALVIRIYHLGSIPPHLTQDEASLGYNAYSILKTGKDEHGKILPIIFKSFGDFKPGLYVYLTTPFIAMLGLSEMAVRLPSVLSGTLNIYLIYLIIHKLYKDQKLGIIAAFIMALNPWNIFFSRGAWEANVALSLTLIGIYYFLRALDKNKYIFFSAIAFALSMLCYQGAKLSSAIVIVILIAVYNKQLIKFNRKYVFSASFLGLLIILPILIGIFNGQGNRLKVFSIFSYPRPNEYTNNFINESGVRRNSISYYLFYSEDLNFLRGIMGRYYNHFSARFLFFEGEWLNPGHAIPKQGQFLLVELIVVLAGLYYFINQKDNQAKQFVWLWLLLSPLPSVLSRDQVNAVRALNMSVPIIIIISFGVYYIFKYRYLKYFLILGYLISIGYFMDAYFIHLPRHNDAAWNWGYKQVMEYIDPKSYEKVVIQQSYSQPYIYYLFYKQYDPKTLQKQIKQVKSSNVYDVKFVESIDNVYFTDIYPGEFEHKNYLVISDDIAMDEQKANSIGYEKAIEFKYYNGTNSFNIYKPK